MYGSQVGKIWDQDESSSSVKARLDLCTCCETKAKLLVEYRKCIDEEDMGIHQNGSRKRTLVVWIWNEVVKAAQRVHWVDDGRVVLSGSLDVGHSIRDGSKTRS